MTIEQFWNIVDRVHRASPGNMMQKSLLLGDELRNLPAPEVKSFADHFDDCADRAYTWELWAAAYIIGGGCSDDAFSDFRSTLISQGKETFERVVAMPETLAEMEVDGESAFYEGYQYMALTVYRRKTGQLPIRSKPQPEDPAGTPWKEEAVAGLYPRLAKKHGFAG